MQNIEALTTEDGDPWALFVWGNHEANEEFRNELISFAISEWEGMDWIEPSIREFLSDMPCEVFYIRNEYELDDDSQSSSEEFPWFFCEKEAVGAVEVTGYKVYNYV